MLSQGGLGPPSALGSSLLLPRAWAALLRLLLQQKVPAQTLRKLAGPVILGEEDVRLTAVAPLGQHALCIVGACAWSSH